MPAVVVKTGPEAGRRMELDREVAIGRQDGDLVLEDPEMSRRHVVLRRSGESVIVEDLDSTNGTFVNGERIRSARAIGPGDELRVGRTKFEIEPDPRADDTIVSRPDRRVDNTIASRPVRQDRIASSDVRSSRDPRTDYEDATQPLPPRVLRSAPAPARSKRGWLVVTAVVLAAIVSLIAYNVLVDRPIETAVTGSANDACPGARRSDPVDLSRTPTRAELQRARNIRLQALGAIRVLGRPEQDAELVATFLSAFGRTNASINLLEKAIAAGKHDVARARANLRQDVRDERELAAKAGIRGCGGLGFA